MWPESNGERHYNTVSKLNVYYSDDTCLKYLFALFYCNSLVANAHENNSLLPSKEKRNTRYILIYTLSAQTRAKLILLGDTGTKNELWAPIDPSCRLF